MPTTIKIVNPKIKERFDQIQRDQSARLHCDMTQETTVEYLLEVFDTYWKEKEKKE